MNRRTVDDLTGNYDPYNSPTRKQRRELRKEFVRDLAEFLGEWELFISEDGKIFACGYFTTPDGKWGYDEVCLGPRMRGKDAEK